MNITPNAVRCARHGTDGTARHGPGVAARSWRSSTDPTGAIGQPKTVERPEEAEVQPGGHTKWRNQKRREGAPRPGENLFEKLDDFCCKNIMCQV